MPDSYFTLVAAITTTIFIITTPSPHCIICGGDDVWTGD